MAYVINDNEVPSAIYGGFATEAYRQGFTSAFQGLVLSSKRLAERIATNFPGAANAFKKNWAFFRQWWKDDPVGAAAGTGAGLLALGVVVVVGGTAIAAVGGGIGGLASLGLLAGSTGKVIFAAIASVTIGTIIRFAVRGVQYLWNFNWQVTDSQLRKQQEELIKSLYGAAGSAVGSTVGTLLCGSAPVALLKRSKLVKVNPMLLAKLKEVSQGNPFGEVGELYEEMYESIRALVNMSGRVASQYMFIESFKNLRKWIKRRAKFSNLDKTFPKLAKLIDKWGDEGSQSWSFASATEEAVESIKDENIRNFTEEAIEGFMDSCTESAMIISYVF